MHRRKYIIANLEPTSLANPAQGPLNRLADNELPVQ